MKKEYSKSTIVYMILFVIAFVAMGIYSGEIFSNELNDILFVISLLLCYPLYIISVILHELGHMVFGLLTGYSFSSFRVFNIMLLNDNGKIVFKKMKLAGTVGQCIMIPKDNKTSFVLFNLGGVIFNVIFAIISFVSLSFVDNNLVKALLFDFGIFNLYDAVTNGIPLKLFINNDMYNIIEFKKDKSSLDFYYNSLYVQNAIVLGKRLKDIDKKYIYKPDNFDTFGNVNEMAFYCNLLMDQLKFKETIKEIESIIDNDKLIKVYRSLLISDLIYCYIILDKDVKEALKYEDDDTKLILKQMNESPSVIRTNYTYALLVDKNKEKANKYLELFNQVKKSYPYKVEIDSELELIEIAKEKDQ